MVASGWFAQKPPAELLQRIRSADFAHVGIDAPRCAVPKPRSWYWEGAKQTWRRRTRERGAGRHCEVVIKAHKLGNPQWSPLVGDEIPAWMTQGFALFARFSALDRIRVDEVFPTASYACLAGKTSPRLQIDLSSCRPGPKDLLDSSVAALTVLEFAQGRGQEVGGGDGLGTIVLPTMLGAPIREVLAWPES
tara:strand:+ start:12672 stop:13247 length:576 start_codon:yes stop_codon:yes gene_type:complete